MRWQVTNLNIDGTIPAQPQLLKQIDKRIDLLDHEKNLRLWPDGNSLEAVKRTVSQFDQSCRHLVFYGTGDLNHLSAVLLENLPVSSKPVTLVLFDNHPDWFDLPPRYHCGNWVSTVLRDPRVEQAILIGQDSEDLQGHSFWTAPFPDLVSGRLQIFPYENKGTFVPLRFPSPGSKVATRTMLGSQLHFQTISSLGVKNLSAQLSKHLAGKNVYIAVDKDVLREQDALTDWEQGQLRLDELLYFIETISASARIVGADVCGERAPRGLDGLAKRIDAGRLFAKDKDDFAQASALNEQTNLAILKALTGVKTASGVTGQTACTF